MFAKIGERSSSSSSSSSSNSAREGQQNQGLERPQLRASQQERPRGELVPRMARLIDAPEPWTGLTNSNYDVRNRTLGRAGGTHPRLDPNGNQVLSNGRPIVDLYNVDGLRDSLDGSRYSSRLGPNGVKVEYKAPERRSRHTAAAHVSHVYYMPASEALLVLAGAHDKPELFASQLFAAEEDAVRDACSKIQRGAFVSQRCLEAVVRQAALEGVSAQVAPTNRGDAGANGSIYRAHNVVAAYVTGLNRDRIRNNAGDAFGVVANAINSIASNERTRDVYSAITTGICLAGVMRMGKNEVERGAKNTNRLEFALGALGLGLAFIPFAGDAISGVIDLLAGSVC